MDDTGPMRRGEGLGQVGEQRSALLTVERAPGEALGQGRAVNPLHHQGRTSVMGKNSVHRDECRVIEPGGVPALSLETPPSHRPLGVGVAQQLERDRSPEDRIPRLVDDRFAADSGNAFHDVIVNLRTRFEETIVHDGEPLPGSVQRPWRNDISRSMRCNRVPVPRNPTPRIGMPGGGLP